MISPSLRLRPWLLVSGCGILLVSIVVLGCGGYWWWARLDTPIVRAHWQVPDHVITLAFSPDSTLLATGSVVGARVRLWRAADGQLVHELDAHTANIPPLLAFTPDGQFLATTFSDGITLWDVRTGSLRWLIPRPGVQLQELRFQSNGQTLVALDATATLHILDMNTGTLQRSIAPPVPFDDERNVTMQISTDGQQAAAIYADRTVRVWRTSDGQLITTLHGLKQSAIFLTFSPDGQRLAASTSSCAGCGLDTLVMWRLVDGRLEQWATGDYYAQIAFSPDGGRVATSRFNPDDDGRPLWEGSENVRIWDSRNGRLLARFKAINRINSQIAFSPDGRLLAVSRDVGDVWIADVAAYQ